MATTDTFTGAGYEIFSPPMFYYDGCEMTASSTPKFKVGDKVVGNNKIGKLYYITTEGWKGIVIKKVEGDDGFAIRVEELNGNHSYEVDPFYFDLVVESKKITKNNTMNKITSQIKRLFNPSLQAQYKAGLIDECGKMTTNGVDELLDLLRDKFNEDFTKVAEDIIAEEKEVK